MQPQCPTHEHVSRRALLKGTLAAGTGGALLNWGNLFNSQAHAATAAKKTKHCILLWMNGGASQFETFDMKVGADTGGPFREIKTNLPGIHICETMPKMAKMMDKITVIRSMHTSQIDHPGGIHLMHTAYSQAANIQFPEIGAVMAKYLGNDESPLPQFVKISSQGNTGSGFLGPKYQPFSLNHSGKLPPFSSNSVDAERDDRRHALRGFLEEKYAEKHKAVTSKMHRAANDSARKLLGQRKAFEIENEWPKYRDLYGDSLFGRRCLMARKLVQSGVAFVEVGQSGYDTHADNFQGHKGLLPPMDHAWAGLLTDLASQGLLENTLVVWMGEIGRTPRINNRAGRDHYVRAWSTALAGCGVKAGYVHGRTDERGLDVAEDEVTEGDFFATVYQALGINPGQENFAGVRPVPIAPFGSKAVKEILA